ncbi:MULTISPECIES: polysaccharide deacetylase family protein [unclassified Thauera]|uniref:polysaccharide deacetylase family protein n=2 Tax=Thauera TaxID=33057 RepID=UPI0002D07D3B|nr:MULTISPECIES: polysaccharide deacetylase family protein [unclassified Thauera]ENO93367.1 polysaccharide deacetylase [Thauera sp. 28]WBL65236.1 polysaccharide deacetylase family protein [Thauera sp. WB-2]HAG74674.1 polysaccharide deacetylase [Thauera sp.]HAY10601.1 polysaccharide deacetylase [Thauera sp.]
MLNTTMTSPAQRVPVLMYHRIGAAHNDWERKYCVSPETFAAQMEALARAGWKAVSIEDFFAWLDGTRDLPQGAFLLTFDDGFAGVHDHAAPVLRRLEWPATVFLVSGLIGERDAWCEKHNPDGHTYPLMDREQILALRAQGFSFHSHTRDHADLPTLDDGALQAQLAGARHDLETLLGEPVDYLAYPYGRYDERVLEQAQGAGYRAAFSVQPGFNRPDVHRFRLRRLDVFGTDTPAMLCRKITLGSNDGRLIAAWRYNADRVLARLGIRH